MTSFSFYYHFHVHFLHFLSAQKKQLSNAFYDKASIINPCMDSSLAFVDKLVQEVKSMHDEAGEPLLSYHFGGVSRPQFGLLQK